MKLPDRICRYPLLFVVLLFFLVHDSYGDNAKTKILRVGYMNTIFFEVDLQDARAAMEIWMRQLSQKIEAGYEPVVTVFDDIPTALAAIQAGEIDFMTMLSIDFIAFRDKIPMTPILIGRQGDSIAEEYVLFTHRENGIKTLDQLQDKTIVVEKNRKSIALMWLETCLLKEGVARGKRIFKNIITVTKPSAALLPVFFRQVDACIVTRRSFDTMAELNPQLEADLIALTRSPGIVHHVFCCHNAFDKNDRKLIIENALELHKSPDSKQILMLFRINKVIPFKPEYLDTAAALVKKYHRLTAE